MQIIAWGKSAVAIFLVLTFQFSIHTGHTRLKPKYPPGYLTLPHHHTHPASRVQDLVQPITMEFIIMSTVARTASTTIVTILGTIGSTAGAAAKLIDNVTSAVDMLDAYVQEAKTSQHEDILIARKDRLRNKQLDAAHAQEKIEAHIVAEYANNPAGGARFNELLAGYESLFAVKP